MAQANFEIHSNSLKAGNIRTPFLRRQLGRKTFFACPGRSGIPSFFYARQFGFKIPFSGIGGFSLIGVLQISGLRISASFKSALPSKNLLAAIPMNLNCQEPHLGLLAKKVSGRKRHLFSASLNSRACVLTLLWLRSWTDSRNLKPPPKKAQRFLTFVTCS